LIYLLIPTDLCCTALPCYLQPRNATHRKQAATAGKWAELLSGAPAISVTGASTFEAVLELLAVKGLHRVYVTDAAGKPVSIITLTDVLRLITKVPAPAPVAAAAEPMDDDDEDDEDDE
jgi:CBS domain-containing protein